MQHYGDSSAGTVCIVLHYKSASEYGTYRLRVDPSKGNSLLSVNGERERKKVTFSHQIHNVKMTKHVAFSIKSTQMHTTT